MSEQRQVHPVDSGSRPASGSARRWRLAFSIATFLAAVALTYGWSVFTGQNGLATGLSFAVRSILSTLLVFAGVFALTGLWGRSSERIVASIPATAAPAPPSTPAPADVPMPPLAAIRSSDTVAPTAENQPPPPTHGPVPAANLPRILFDTGEMPAITSLAVGEADREKRQHARPLPPPYPDTPGK